MGFGWGGMGFGGVGMGFWWGGPKWGTGSGKWEGWDGFWQGGSGFWVWREQVQGGSGEKTPRRGDFSPNGYPKPVQGNGNGGATGKITPTG